MKSFTITVLFLVSFLTLSLCFAFPTLNDAVKFTGTKVVNGVSLEYSFSDAITQVTPAHDKFFHRMETTVSDQTQVSEEWLNKESLMTPKEIATYLSSCEESNHGEHEFITTAGKTFDTCHKKITGEESLYELWIGNVPFGAVRFKETFTKDGSVIDATLQSYTEGQE